MNKKIPKIVIADLKYPMNLGSIARSMSCCGYKQLELLRPCKDWNSMDAIKYSLFGRPILEKANVVDDLSKIKNKDSVLFAFSRRIGKKRSNPIFLSELGDFIKRFYPDKKPVFVFGGESSGLNTDELNLCDHTVTIDKPILDGSLSLPVAVAVVMYEHKRSMLDAGHNIKSNIAEPGQAGALLDRSKELLKKIRFIGNRDDRRVMAKIKDIVKKLSVNEVRLLHTILARAGEEGKNTHESKKQ